MWTSQSVSTLKTFCSLEALSGIGVFVCASSIINFCLQLKYPFRTIFTLFSNYQPSSFNHNERQMLEHYAAKLSWPNKVLVVCFSFDGVSKQIMRNLSKRTERNFLMSMITLFFAIYAVLRALAEGGEKKANCLFILFSTFFN